MVCITRKVRKSGWRTRALICSVFTGLVGGVAVGARAAQGPPLDAAAIASAVEAVGQVVRREYFDPAVGDMIDARLRASLASGRYAGATTAEALAALLTGDLYAATNDKHLAVSVQPAALESPSVPSSPDDSRALAGRRSNFGVRRVEVLPGNVGYLDVTAFFRIEEAREALAAAMRVVKNTDALIIDMRANGGGSPGTVAWLMGYLIDGAAMPLFDIEHRAPEPPDRYATEATLPDERDSRRPLIVLTSSKTFSAGEGFAFLLQERHRAEIVGEVTAGAANPGRSYPVDARFSVVVPNGRVKSAVSGGNWEGRGVVPDVRIAAHDALTAAHARALSTLIERQPPGPWRDALQRALRDTAR